MTLFQLPKPANFENTLEDKNTHLLTLQNRTGMQIALTDYGARLVSALIPDKHGDLVDVVLGFDSISKYLDAQEKYHGATVGRVCNRIANGKFALAGNEYTLAKNNGENALHGGPLGFHTKVWDRQVSFKKKVDFYYISPDGEEGYPGKVTTNVSYELTNENEIIIHFRASTDKTTILNLTNHAYFNLNGEGNGNILNHYAQIDSTEFLPINAKQIPVGKLASVENTALDFRRSKQIKDNIGNKEDQIQYANGYDHSFINHNTLDKAIATVYSAETGIQLEVFTDLPTIHFYSGNFLSNDIGKAGNPYEKHGGFCLEAQHCIDSPNQKHFPNIELQPGEEYTATIIYKFGIIK